MNIKQTTVKCDSCGKTSNMVLDPWNRISLPKEWRYRTRSFTVEGHVPTDIQIACSEECAKKL